MKMGTRPSLSQKIRLVGGYLRSSSLGIVAVIVRTIAWQLNRLVCIERLTRVMCRCGRDCPALYYFGVLIRNRFGWHHFHADAITR